MSGISKLLAVQELDLAGDGLLERRRTLPERAALLRCQAEASALDQAHAGLLERRAELGEAEKQLSAEVDDAAGAAKTAEDKLYSGSVKIAKELEAIQEELRLLRDRQSSIEVRQMALLEEIDQMEGQVEENRAARSRSNEEAHGLETSISQAEGGIDAEVAKLAQQRGAESSGLPPSILEEYERLRTKQRLAGRAAARLADGACGGCRIRLPVMEYNRMKAEANDAPLHCPQCGRLMVR